MTLLSYNISMINKNTKGKSSTKLERSWPVTITAGTLTVLSAALGAVSIIMLDDILVQILIGIFFGSGCLLFSFYAVVGQKKSLPGMFGALFELLFG